jgi:hypothetical protein
MPITNFQELFVFLEKWGVADILVPFLLIFTVVFAVLERSKVLGDKKNFNVIVALSIALIVVIPHVMGTYPPGRDAVEIINTALPNISVVIVAIIMFLVLAGTFGVRLPLGTGVGFFALASLLVVAFIFGNAAGWWSGVPSWIDKDTQALIVMILVFGVIIWFITGGGGGAGAGFSKIREGLDKLFPH